MKSNIKPHVNQYYLTVLDDMLGVLDRSTPGKKQWYDSHRSGETYDYRSTIRSTFPSWSKFFYEKPPKNKYIDYCTIDGPKPYEDGYFNGNTKELKRILRNSRNGKLSKYERISTAWEIAVLGFLSEIRDIEQQSGENYYPDEIFEEFPF
jgi:hypothetical protein